MWGRQRLFTFAVAAACLFILTFEFSNKKSYAFRKLTPTCLAADGLPVLEIQEKTYSDAITCSNDVPEYTFFLCSAILKLDINVDLIANYNPSQEALLCAFNGFDKEHALEYLVKGGNAYKEVIKIFESNQAILEKFFMENDIQKNMFYCLDFADNYKCYEYFVRNFGYPIPKDALKKLRDGMVVKLMDMKRN